MVMSNSLCLSIYYIASSNCTNGSVQLVDGGGNRRGRVELCENGTWWAISDKYWNNSDAKVVCKDLGYPANCELKAT